jgi:polar amino acid transport system substrate-binding protein
MMRFVILVFVGALFGAWSASAETISVLTYEWRPYNYEEEGVVKGISTEVVREVLKRADIDADIRVYPWSRAYRRALEEENVLIFTIARTPEREELFKFLCPIAPPVNNVLLKLRERTDITVSSLDDVGRYRIGVQNQDVMHQILLRAGFQEERCLFPVTQNEQNLKKLLDGRIDLMAGHDLPTFDLLKRMNLPADRVQAAYTFESFEECAAFSRQTADDLVERVRRAVEAVNGEGLIENCAKKYLDR